METVWQGRGFRVLSGVVAGLAVPGRAGGGREGLARTRHGTAGSRRRCLVVRPAMGADGTEGSYPVPRPGVAADGGGAEPRWDRVEGRLVSEFVLARYRGNVCKDQARGIEGRGRAADVCSNMGPEFARHV